MGGTTVAVLGSGIDVALPGRRTGSSLGAIAAAGTLVSEYPPGVPAEPFRFPARNRLIAALSLGVVIVEGGARERYAKHRGLRPTRSGSTCSPCPGPVTSALSDAPHALIRDGARLIRGVDDLLDDLGLEPVDLSVTLEGLPRRPARRARRARSAPLLPEARRHRRRASASARPWRPSPNSSSSGWSGRSPGGITSRSRPPRPCGCHVRGRVAADARPGDCVGHRPLGRYALAAAGPAGASGEDPCHATPTTSSSPKPTADRRCVRRASRARTPPVAEHGGGVPHGPRAPRHLPGTGKRDRSRTRDHETLRRFLAQQHALGYARASIARRVGAIHTFYRWALRGRPRSSATPRSRSAARRWSTGCRRSCARPRRPSSSSAPAPASGDPRPGRAGRRAPRPGHPGAAVRLRSARERGGRRSRRRRSTSAAPGSP